MGVYAPDRYAVMDGQGQLQPLSRWAGQVLLVVNTASACGFTPQFAGLQTLWQRHREAGLTVLGFPCNQFGGQDPGSQAEITAFCQLNYGVDFPVMAKIEVNGSGADPFWRHLCEQAPGLLGSQAIKWNFTKFLIGRDGRVLERYAPQTAPARLEADILKALAA
ncbi:MAG: glutathione peroxidase BsaA [Pseudomonadota bacterium]|jgi:glutathione peroxidase